MSLHIRAMTLVDVSIGMHLKEMAGWNQTEEDWHRFLRASPDGCFIGEWNGHAAGTVATVVYGDVLAWVGMVLVDPQFRGQGIGTALLTTALNHLSGKKVPCVKLDATPQGRPIYERQGFRVEYEIERCLLERPNGAGAAVGDSKRTKAASLAGIEVLENEVFENILAMDREVFGADRGDLLRSVASGAPEFVIAAKRGASLDGYALGRKGSVADHLGPWIALNESAARSILEQFLARSRRDVIFVDAVQENPWTPKLLVERGFRNSRSLTRMYRGENKYPGQPKRVCAILGPEFG